MIDEIVTGKQVTLRPVQADDEAKLSEIFSDPEVARWWGDPAKSVQDGLENTDDNSQFLIELDGEAIGFIQCTEETDPMYRHASVDISVRSAWQGRGLGPKLLAMLIQVARDEKLSCLRADVLPENTEMQRICEKAGFTLKRDLDEDTVEAAMRL